MCMTLNPELAHMQRQTAVINLAERAAQDLAPRKRAAWLELHGMSTMVTVGSDGMLAFWR